jgi:hypothetical protein
MPSRSISLLSPSSITKIDCGLSSPKLGGTINLSAFTNLQEFRCIGNDITVIIGYTNNVNLLIVDFNNNKINGTIPDLTAMTGLQIFRCNSNQFQGNIPKLPSSIVEFRCNNNTLVGIMPTLALYSNLSIFYVNNNTFNAYVDSAIPVLINGNFETFNAAGVPIGWSATDVGLSSSLSATNSPFTNVFPNNSKCWRLVDISSTEVAGFSQAFSTAQQYLNIAVEFDFKISGNNGTWGVQFDAAGAISTVTTSSAHFRIIASAGTFSIYNGLTGQVDTIRNISINTWYRVKAVLCTTTVCTTIDQNGNGNGAGYQYGSITEFNGSTTNWNNIPLINTSVGFNRILVRDRVLATNSDLFLDNFRISPAVSPTLGDFQVQNNSLTAAAVNDILRAFVAAEKTTGTRILNLGGAGNAAPTGQGLIDKATLQSRGWTVTTN